MIKNIVKVCFILFALVIVTFTAHHYYSLYKSNQLLIEARKIDPTVWEQDYINQPIKDKYKIAIITGNGGEWSIGKYLKKTAENLGWQAKIYFQTSRGHETEILQFDPDFILFPLGIDFNFSQDIISHRSKKYGIYYFPINTEITDLSIVGLNLIETIMYKEYTFDAELKPNINLRKMIHISDGLLVTAKELKIIDDYYQSIHKKFYGIRIVPTVYKTNYEPADPKYLTIIGFLLGDKNRGSNKFKTVLSKLDNDNILKTYGIEQEYWFIPNSYHGFINDNGALLDTMHRNGIALIVHRKQHSDNAVPSIRIMEAVAANVLVISDKNPFIVEHFGDNVLYFDITADADTMYNQIKDHYDWAIANPDQAKAMADRAHKIFLEKFTSEQSLIRIAKMHEKILADEKIRNLEFPAK